MKTNKLLTILIAFVMMLAMVLTGCGSSGSGSDDQATNQNEAVSADQPLTSIVFASDFQEEPGFEKPAENLCGILDAMQADGQHPSNVVICGDYTNNLNYCNHELSPDDSIKELRSTVYKHLPDVVPDNMIFVQGNHDKMTDAISQSGLHEYKNYLVYVVNTEEDFPWKQGKKKAKSKVEKTASDMKATFDELIANGEKRPVFIAGHVPLHFTARTSSIHKNGDNLYGGIVFDVVNEAAQNLDIVYFTGHNHSKGWDCYLGGSCMFKSAGDKILLPDASGGGITTDKYREETLNFTYMNAGYLGYYANCSIDEVKAGKTAKYAVADTTLTATLVQVYEDRIELTRYDASGVHNLGAAGAANPYKSDKKLISSDKYSSETSSKQVINRK